MTDKITQALMGGAQDPVQWYLEDNGSKHSLAAILDALAMGGAGGGAVGSLLTGHPLLSPPLAYLAKQSFDSMNANSDASQRFMQGAQGFENTGLPGRPGAGRFADPRLAGR